MRKPPPPFPPHLFCHRTNTEKAAGVSRVSAAKLFFNRGKKTNTQTAVDDGGGGRGGDAQIAIFNIDPSSSTALRGQVAEHTELVYKLDPRLREFHILVGWELAKPSTNPIAQLCRLRRGRSIFAEQCSQLVRDVKTRRRRANADVSE